MTGSWMKLAAKHYEATQHTKVLKTVGCILHYESSHNISLTRYNS